MKHIIYTKFKFDDKDRMKKYLLITNDILIPSLKSQSVKDFIWILEVRPDDEDFLRHELDYPFTAVYSKNEMIDYVISNSINLQTRHDCDDYMSPDYIEKLQEIYESNISKYDKFLVQSQPIKLMYDTGAEVKIRLYHETRCSMHLTLCQSDVINHIYEHPHGQMYKVTPNVISMGEGYTKWVIHGNNITVIGK